MTMVMDIPFIANNFPVFINGSGIPPHPHCHLPHSLVLLVREIGFACYHRVLRVLLRFFSHSKSFSFDVARYEPYLICNLVRSRFSVFFFKFFVYFFVVLLLLLICCVFAPCFSFSPTFLGSRLNLFSHTLLKKSTNSAWACLIYNTLNSTQSTKLFSLLGLWSLKCLQGVWDLSSSCV